MQQLLVTTGARDEVERLIESLVLEVTAALTTPVSAASRALRRPSLWVTPQAATH